MYINSQLLIISLLKKTWRRHVHYNFRLHTYLSFDIHIEYLLSHFLFYFFYQPIFVYCLFIKSKLTDFLLLLHMFVSNNLNENKVGLNTLDKIRLEEMQSKRERTTADQHLLALRFFYWKNLHLTRQLHIHIRMHVHFYYWDYWKEMKE